MVSPERANFNHKIFAISAKNRRAIEVKERKISAQPVTGMFSTSNYF